MNQAAARMRDALKALPRHLRKQQAGSAIGPYFRAAEVFAR